MNFILSFTKFVILCKWFKLGKLGYVEKKSNEKKKNKDLANMKSLEYYFPKKKLNKTI